MSGKGHPARGGFAVYGLHILPPGTSFGRSEFVYDRSVRLAENSARRFERPGVGKAVATLTPRDIKGFFKHALSNVPDGCAILNDYLIS